MKAFVSFLIYHFFFKKKKKIHLKSNVLFSVKYKNFTTVAERGVIIRDFPNSHYRHKLFFFFCSSGDTLKKKITFRARTYKIEPFFFNMALHILNRYLIEKILAYCSKSFRCVKTLIIDTKWMENLI